MKPPADPISAVTHPDPYPYYRELVARSPFSRDDTLGLWVAASADAVTAVLASPLGRVRPVAEPVPFALAGSPAAEIFGRLVRMTDGPDHGAMKQAVATTIESIDTTGARAVARRWAATLAAEIGPRSSPKQLDDFTLALSAHVIASLLGVPDLALAHADRYVSRYVSGVSPGADVARLERGKEAARDLIDLVGSPVVASEPGLLSAFGREARRAGCEDPGAVVANAIGFMTQAYEATAGLIGNTLLALAIRPELSARIPTDAGLLDEVIREVLRHDPPVQNTRRFIAADGQIAGRRVTAGDTVLVVLAAANHDAAANPGPERFDAARAHRRTFTFGAGPHACPGERLAITIAAAGIEGLLARGLARGLPLGPLAGTVAYRPSANVRVPLFAGGTG
jgi:cytochrome P450